MSREPMITFRAFTKTFGADRAVEALSLAVEAGEVVALLGPNGSGKTTTLKAAAGLIRPTAGEVLLGSPGRPSHEPAARRTISFLPQRVAFPEALTGQEVVDFYRALRGIAPSRTTDVLRFASLNGARSRTVATYSGGMVQRLGLAVAMLPDAQALLLDEPTAALDPEGLTAFYELVDARKREGRTVFFSSHQLGDAERLADRFAILVDGRLVRVLGQRELRDRLAERGVMRVKLARGQGGRWKAAGGTVPASAADLLDELRTPWDPASEVGLRIEGDEIVVSGPPAARLAALDRLRAAGVWIVGLTAEDGRLDAFYRELVGGWL